jgi:hypothetical protein
MRLVSPEQKEAFYGWYDIINAYIRYTLTQANDKLPCHFWSGTHLWTVVGVNMETHQTPQNSPAYRQRKTLSRASRGVALAGIMMIIGGSPRSGRHEPLKGLRVYRAPSFSWASLSDNEQAGYFHGGTNPIIPEYSPLLLQVNVTTTSPDQFGQVSRARIKLRGSTVPFTRLRDTDLDEAGGFEPIGIQYFDFEGTYDEYDKLVSQMMIFRLSVTMRRSGELGQMYSLLLMPTGREVGEY